MTVASSIGWAEVLPGHIPGVQVLDRLLAKGWPGPDPAGFFVMSDSGLMAEAALFLPHLTGTEAVAIMAPLMESAMAFAEQAQAQPELDV